MAVITGQGDMYDSSMGQNYCTILHTIRRDRDISLAAINLKLRETLDHSIFDRCILF